MIHLSAKKGAAEGDLGFYAIRRISSIHGNTIGLDRGIDEEFSAAVAVRDYKVQLVKIPNYRTLTVGADAVLVPLLWDGVKGGLVALKTTGDCTIQGKIVTEATGPKRTDSHALTHTDIAERFILTGLFFHYQVQKSFPHYESWKDDAQSPASYIVHEVPDMLRYLKHFLKKNLPNLTSSM